MAMEIKQSLRLSQSLVMTPQLQQAIKLLQLNRMELAEVITQEMMENPILEETSEASEELQAAQTDVSGVESSESEARNMEEVITPSAQTEDDRLVAGKDDFNWEAYIEDFNSSSSTLPSTREINEDLPNFENILTKTPSLEEHLRWQLSVSNFTDDERKFGELVIGNLSDDGYLIAQLEDLANESGLHIEDAGEVLKMLQRFDPIGVGSRDLRECLLVQAELMEPRDELLEKVISDHLSDLEKKNYQSIARAMSIPLEKVIELTRVIMDFEPKPGRIFQSSDDTYYITPDIYVYKVANEFVISLNDDGIPKLKISPYYKELLSKAARGGSLNAMMGGTAISGPTDGSHPGMATTVDKHKITKEYVQDKLRAAVWLIRSIHNRQKTIYKVTEAIVKRQREFFEKGVSVLKPMILKDVANDIGMHESTISRVTTNKYVHTPVGIFELKYFFNSSINSADGSDAVASEAVKEKIRHLVAKEDQKNPLSDQKIVEMLKQENIDIARRTVAKYRDMLGILSSGKRKKVI